jgi:DNA-binding transcriptional LysR family regulator
LKVKRGEASLDEVAEQTLLVREAGSSTRLVAEHYLTRVGYRPAKRWELDSNEAIKRAVQAGLGIAFVSKLVVEDELRRAELVSFQIAGVETMRRSIQLLRPAGRELTPSERAFVLTLCSCCDAEVAGCTASQPSAKTRTH